MRLVAFLTICVANISVVVSFNLATNEGTTKVISAPAVELQKAGNASESTKTVQPFYFGYSIILLGGRNSPRLTIGAPKLMHPDDIRDQDQNKSNSSQQYSRGSIESCNVATLFENVTDECQPAHPPNPQAGDNFGLALSLRPDGNSFTCSTTRGLDCGNVKSNPGFCYKSNDFGNTWNATENSKYTECPSSKVEVLFLLDGSYSIGDDFSKVKDWVKNISKSIWSKEDRVRVGVVQYSSYSDLRDINEQHDIKTHIRIGEYRMYKLFERNVDVITLLGHETYTGQALRKAISDFQGTEYYNETTTNQVMILLTDGRATDKEDVPEYAAKLRAIGITPFAVGVGKVNMTELRIIATGDPENSTRVLTIKDFDGLDVIAKNLKKEIKGMILEGEGNQNDTNYPMQFAELGQALTYGKPKPRSTSLSAKVR